MGVNRVAPIVTGQSTAQTIKGSLRFDASNDYLSKTFGSGNTNTWTWSGWIKKSFTAETAVPSGDGIRGIFTARSSGTNYAQLSIAGSGGNYGNKIRFLERDGTGVVAFLVTSQDFRDPSAWFHLVLVWDSSSGTSGDRVRLYINGTRVTAFSTETYPTSSANSVHNTAIAHNLGYDAEGTAYFDGYMSNVTFIDGQALGPGFFGFTDPLTGTWRPKKFRAQGTTVNDGTVWSSLVNVSNATVASGTAANLFDGDTTTKINISGGYIEIDLSSRNVQAGPEGIEVYNNEGGAYTSYQVNGREVINWQASAGWMSMGGANSKINTIRINYLSGGGVNAAFAFRVNGVIMIDSTTQNLDFGTNGFYLPLDDQNDYTTDKSGKGNNWTANGFTGTSSNPDVVPDSPSGVVGSTKPTSGITTTSSITKPSNYATWNPLKMGTSDVSMSEGNLFWRTTSNGPDRCTYSTIGMTSGKYYWENEIVEATATGIGIANEFANQDAGPAQSHNWMYYSATGQAYLDGSASTYGDAYNTNGTIIGVAFDRDNLTLEFYKDGVSQGKLTSISGLTDSETYFAMCGDSGGASQSQVRVNFGQKPFKHQPPDGYLTLCSANARPSTVVTRPDQYVGVTTYTGNGSTQSINVGFKPDLVWVKNRNGANNNVLQDSVRGFGSSKNLSSNQTQIEGADTDGVITGVTNTGFNVSVNGVSGNGTNRTNYTYVGWCWKAGGGSGTGGEFWKDDVKYATASAAGLTAGTITPTGASVGTKQGFSIIKYNGNATSGATVPHGLSQTPDLVIVKQTSGTDESWRVRHSSVDPTKTLYLNQTVGETSNTEYISGATSSTFTLSTGLAGVNASQGYIAYCWHSVPGLQKFGSYTGNGVSGDGPYIHLEFRPRFFMHKRTDAGDSNQDWRIWDSERVKYNTVDTMLQPNDSAGDYTNSAVAVDFLSNGVKIRATDTANNNASGGTYIYAAFAEQPAFNLYGGQSLAR